MKDLMIAMQKKLVDQEDIRPFLEKPFFVQIARMLMNCFGNCKEHRIIWQF